MLMDTTLEKILQHLFVNKGSIGLAAATLSAVQDRYPRAKGNLPISWRSYGSWKFMQPFQIRRAWPAQLLLAVARILNRAGMESSALAILLGFHCLLRPAEICSLRRRHIVGGANLPFLDKQVGLVVLEKTPPFTKGVTQTIEV